MLKLDAPGTRKHPYAAVGVDDPPETEDLSVEATHADECVQNELFEPLVETSDGGGEDSLVEFEQSSTGAESGDDLVEDIMKEKHKRSHKPADPNCEGCMRGKTRNKRKLKNASTREPAKKYGDILTFDHVMMRDCSGQSGVGVTTISLIALIAEPNGKVHTPLRVLTRWVLICR